MKALDNAGFNVHNAIIKTEKNTFITVPYLTHLLLRYIAQVLFLNTYHVKNLS